MTTGIAWSATAKLLIGTPVPGRYAVGFQVDQASVGQDVEVTLSRDGAVFSTITHTVEDNFENRVIATTISNGVTFEVRGADVGKDVIAEVNPSGASTATITRIQSYQPDRISGVVQQFAAGLHSSPQAIEFDGQTLIAHHEIFTGDRYLSLGLAPVGGFPAKIFGSVTARDAHDTYHTTTVMIQVNSGVFMVMCDHNSEHWAIWSATVEGLKDATPFSLGTSGSTYAQLASIDASTVSMLYRNNARNGARLLISDIQDGSATLVDDVVFSGGAGVNVYPRGCQTLRADDGSPLAALAYQLRITSNTNWADFGVAILDDTGQAYNLNGVAFGAAALGTDGAPKLVFSGQLNTVIGLGGLAIADERPGYQRYTQTPVLSGIDTWNAGTRQAYAIGMFVDSQGITSAQTGVDKQVRFVYQDGGTRYVSTSGLDIFGLDSALTYRVFYAARWTAPRVAEFYIGLPLAGFVLTTDDYFNFGSANQIAKYTLDLNGVASSADLENAISEAGVIPLPNDDQLVISNGFVGESGTLLGNQSDGIMDQTVRQGRTLLLSGLAEEAPTINNLGDELAALSKQLSRVGVRIQR